MKNTQIDRYLIERAISSDGGAASVYLAGLVNNPKYKVAIKVARTDDDPNVSSHEDMLLKWEADFLSRWDCRHPGIVRILPTPVNSSVEYVVRAPALRSSPWYMVMEYLPGGSLAEKLKEIQSFSLDWKLELIYQLLLSVAFIHSKGFAHRDLKPDNIVFREKISPHLLPQPVLVDFGLVSDGKEHREVMDNAFTPQYAAPERLLSPMGYTFDNVLPSDIWSLGVIFYELLTGKFLFTGNKEKVRTTLIRGPLDTRLPDDDERYHVLAQFIRAMLSRDPGKRPTIKEILYAVEEEFLPPRLPL